MSKSYLFLEALTLPAAQYRATGRGVILYRMAFVDIWRKYALSHFYLGFELVVGATVYSLYSNNALGPVTAFDVTWPFWLMVFAVFASPFLFNFTAFDYQAVQMDIGEWRVFVQEMDDLSPMSWNAW
eukprot:SAG31_NODE_6684_length_1925_cov_1.533406_2_plen_127_part_00